LIGLDEEIEVMKREMEELNAINEAKLESLKQDELPQIKNIEP
jgi:hypothetical protein